MAGQGMDWDDLFGPEKDETENGTIAIQTADLYQGIPGLELRRDALTHEQQMRLIHDIINQHPLLGTKEVNQAMWYGDLPPHLAWLNDWVRAQPGLLPSSILKREPLFDQAIINLYQRGEGIVSHVDLARFEDGIVIISLLSSCAMTLQPAQGPQGKSYGAGSTRTDQAIDIILRPGDVLALSGPARYDWEHGIQERDRDVVDGCWIERGTRVSVTLRRNVVPVEKNGLTHNTRHRE